MTSVSVCMITYNHESYIREAIEAVLMQEFNGELRLLVSNDCSTDNTHQVISKLVNEHPKGHLINYINHTTNIGMMPNFISTLEACDGDFIALCEGDDVWTNESKIQLQLDALEASKESVMCYHDSNLINEHSEEFQASFLTPFYKRNFTPDDLKKSMNIITSSIIFRNVIEKFPEQFVKVFNGDTFLISLLGNYGSGIYLDKIMSSYRKHEGGVWTKNSKLANLNHKTETFRQLHLLYKQKLDHAFADYYKYQYKAYEQEVKRLNCEGSFSLSCLKLKIVLSFNQSMKSLKKLLKKMLNR